MAFNLLYLQEMEASLHLQTKEEETLGSRLADTIVTTKLESGVTLNKTLSSNPVCGTHNMCKCTL